MDHRPLRRRRSDCRLLGFTPLMIVRLQTVNFVHLFPTCCVSIGFCVKCVVFSTSICVLCSFASPRSKVPVVGAIFAPILGGLHLTNASGTLFSAAKGLGAWSTPINFPYNSSVLAPAPSSSTPNPSLKPQPWQHAMPLPYLPPQPLPSDAPKGCLYLSEWGKARLDTPESNLSRKVTSFHNMAAEIGGRGGKGGMVHGVRSLGSATLDCVYVATGAVDIFWEGG